jgi:hypothetical protein
MQTHKKELEKNVLAEQLTRAYDGLKHGPSRGTLVFIGVVVGGLLLYFLFRYFYYSSEATASQRWVLLDDAIFPEQLSLAMEKSELADTPQLRLARFKEARFQLSQGLRDLGGSSNKEARKQIEDATEIYEKLAKSSGRLPPLLHQEALWGAAKGYEAQGGTENVNRAIELYEKLVKEYASSALGKDAKKQLDRLGSDSTKQDLIDLNKELNPPARSN